MSLGKCDSTGIEVKEGLKQAGDLGATVHTLPLKHRELLYSSE